LCLAQWPWERIPFGWSRKMRISGKRVVFVSGLFTFVLRLKVNVAQASPRIGILSVRNSFRNVKVLAQETVEDTWIRYGPSLCLALLSLEPSRRNGIHTQVVQE